MERILDDDPPDVADLLAEAGAVVGGGAALFAVLGLVSGSFMRDLASRSRWARSRGWDDVDPVRMATRLAPFGGLFGLTSLIVRWTGLD